MNNSRSFSTSLGNSYTVNFPMDDIPEPQNSGPPIFLQNSQTSFSIEYSEKELFSNNVSPLNRLPLPESCSSYNEYFRLAQNWYIETKAFVSNCLPPVPVGFSYHSLIPPKILTPQEKDSSMPESLVYKKSFSPKNSPLLPANQNLLIERIITGSSISPDDVFPIKGPRGQNILFDDYLHDNLPWDSQLIPFQPSPYMFSSYQDYKDSLLRWSDHLFNNLSIIPLHSTDFSSLLHIERVSNSNQLDSDLIQENTSFLSSSDDELTNIETSSSNMHIRYVPLKVNPDKFSEFKNIPLQNDLNIKKFSQLRSLYQFSFLRAIPPSKEFIFPYGPPISDKIIEMCNFGIDKPISQKKRTKGIILCNQKRLPVSPDPANNQAIHQIQVFIDLYHSIYEVTTKLNIFLTFIRLLTSNSNDIFRFIFSKNYVLSNILYVLGEFSDAFNDTCEYISTDVDHLTLAKIDSQQKRLEKLWEYRYSSKKISSSRLYSKPHRSTTLLPNQAPTFTFPNNNILDEILPEYDSRLNQLQVPKKIGNLTEKFDNTNDTIGDPNASNETTGNKNVENDKNGNPNKHADSINHTAKNHNTAISHNTESINPKNGEVEFEKDIYKLTQRRAILQTFVNIFLQLRLYLGLIHMSLSKDLVFPIDVVKQKYEAQKVLSHTLLEEEWLSFEEEIESMIPSNSDFLFDLLFLVLISEDATFFLSKVKIPLILTLIPLSDQFPAQFLRFSSRVLNNSDLCYIFRDQLIILSQQRDNYIQSSPKIFISFLSRLILTYLPYTNKHDWIFIFYSHLVSSPITSLKQHHEELFKSLSLALKYRLILSDVFPNYDNPLNDPTKLSPTNTDVNALPSTFNSKSGSTLLAPSNTNQPQNFMIKTSVSSYNFLPNTSVEPKKQEKQKFSLFSRKDKGKDKKPDRKSMKISSFSTTITPIINNNSSTAQTNYYTNYYSDNINTSIKSFSSINLMQEINNYPLMPPVGTVPLIEIETLLFSYINPELKHSSQNGTILWCLRKLIWNSGSYPFIMSSKSILPTLSSILSSKEDNQNQIQALKFIRDSFFYHSAFLKNLKSETYLLTFGKTLLASVWWRRYYEILLMCILLHKKYESFKDLPQLALILRGAKFKYKSALYLIESHIDEKHRAKYLEITKYLNSNQSLLHFLQKVEKSIS